MKDNNALMKNFAEKYKLGLFINKNLFLQIPKLISGMQASAYKNRFLLLYNLGNLLMLVSISVLLYIFYPLLFVYMDPPALKAVPKKGEFIRIEKIHAQAPIVENVDPWNETEYRKKLFNGVAQAKGTSRVGERGTIYLFSHSSDLPWRITQYNVAFYRLNELKKGDIIQLVKNGKSYNYKVSRSITVWPQEIAYLKDNLKKDQLILQTCTPVGTALQRLLVFALPSN